MAVTRSMSAINSNTDSSSNNRNLRNVNSTKNQNRKKRHCIRGEKTRSYR